MLYRRWEICWRFESIQHGSSRPDYWNVSIVSTCLLERLIDFRFGGSSRSESDHHSPSKFSAAFSSLTISWLPVTQIHLGFEYHDLTFSKMGRLSEEVTWRRMGVLDMGAYWQQETGPSFCSQLFQSIFKPDIVQMGNNVAFIYYVGGTKHISFLKLSI